MKDSPCAAPPVVLAIPPVATIDETADILRTCRTEVYDLIAQGLLETYVDGRKRRVIGGSIARHIERNTQAIYDPITTTPRRDASREKRAKRG